MAVVVMRASVLFLVLVLPGTASLAAEGVDSSALLQVSMDLSADEQEQDRRPSSAMIKATLDNSLNVYQRKVEEDRAVMGEIAQKAVSAFVQEIQQHIKTGIQLLPGMELARKAKDAVVEKQKQVQQVGARITSGEFGKEVQAWAGKMLNTTAEMAKQFVQTHQDWQKLAASSLSLESQTRGLRESLAK
uniref:Uncharacterized protein n=1 Tax=Alexandrium andersonii TaxID=327968 RepID=A0A7S2AVC7_9DINO